jgi:hypothetical protein
VAGVGVEIAWVEAALALEARYTSSLISIVDDFEVRNRGVQPGPGAHLLEQTSLT